MRARWKEKKKKIGREEAKSLQNVGKVRIDALGAFHTSVNLQLSYNIVRIGLLGEVY